MEDTGANRSLLPREILPGVLVCSDAHEVARAAARFFVDWAWQAIAREGHFNVALSGGSTPRELYRLLATSEFRAQVDWPRVHLFWGDERAVPPESPESNYGMVRRELLLRVPIPVGNVHRMKAEEPVIGRAAHEYETILRRCLPVDDRGFPILDLVLLGLGGEGHTASLFPGSAFMRETSHWVSTPMIAKLGMRRMTLTLPVLEAARHVLFLVTGSGKAEILRKVLSEPGEHPLPAQMVIPRNGERAFLVDEGAASLLGAKPAGKPPSPAKGATPPAGRAPRSEGNS
jgi:6-phosphogluconolactonase